MAENGDLPLIFAGIDLDDLDGIELLRQLQDAPPLRSSRKVLLTLPMKRVKLNMLLQRRAVPWTARSELRRGVSNVCFATC